VVIAIVSTWFVRDSVLYEHTDDAQIDGEIVPMFLISFAHYFNSLPREAHL
jgi:hypothetical protein